MQDRMHKEKRRNLAITQPSESDFFCRDKARFAGRGGCPKPCGKIGFVAKSELIGAECQWCTKSDEIDEHSSRKWSENKSKYKRKGSSII